MAVRPVLRLPAAELEQVAKPVERIDHLDGLLFLDRVGSLHADVFPRKRYR